MRRSPNLKIHLIFLFCVSTNKIKIKRKSKKQPHQKFSEKKRWRNTKFKLDIPMKSPTVKKENHLLRLLENNFALFIWTVYFFFVWQDTKALHKSRTTTPWFLSILFHLRMLRVTKPIQMLVLTTSWIYHCVMSLCAHLCTLSSCILVATVRYLLSFLCLIMNFILKCCQDFLFQGAFVLRSSYSILLCYIA